MVAAASPSAAPAPHAAAGRPHPTYIKMITHALTVLGGASARPAIAEYILGRYSGLPARHDNLLSAHLRRLVSEGILRTDGADSPSSYIFDPPAPSEGKRGPGLPRKDSDASTPVHVQVPVVGGEKRGRGRPRKNPQGSSDKAAALAAHTGAGIAAPSVLPAKRKLPGEDDDPSLTKRGPGKPITQEAAPIQDGAEASSPIREALGGEKASTYHNGWDATTVQSGGALSTGIKRGRGRPRKDKPLKAAMSPESVPTTGVKRGRGRPRKEKPSEEAAAAMSPTAGSVAAASMRFKRGCGRPSMQKPSAAASYENGVSAAMGIKTGGGTPRMDNPAAAISAESRMEKLAAAAAAMYAEAGGDAAASAGIQAGGGQSRIEKLAAAVAAISANKGHGMPREEKPAVPAGVKRSRGRPRKDQCITGLVEAAVEGLFRDMMTRREEEDDLVSGDKMQTEEGVAPGDRNETRAAAMSAEGGDAASMGIDAGGGTPRMEASSAARSPETGDVSLTGVKRPRGRPRKNPAAAMPAETGDAASTGVKRGRGRPRMEDSSAARSLQSGDAASTGVKRGRGRPRKNPAAAMSAETGDAASTGVRGRGRPRKKKRDAASTGVKRGRGRPRKNPAAAMSAETGDAASTGLKRSGFVEAAGEVLFRDVTEARGNLVSGKKTQTEGATPGDRKETRAADAGFVPVSGGNAAISPAEAGSCESLVELQPQRTCEEDLEGVILVVGHVGSR